MKLQSLILAGVALLGAGYLVAEENWPEFRGPLGDGTSRETGLPVTWSETNHIKWKTAIHGRAWSSPVVWKEQIWLTTASEDGRELYGVEIDRASGKIVRDSKLFEVEHPQYAHPFNSYGSPTPAIEEGRVYISFGSPGTACLDTSTGKVLWERRDFVCNHYRGAGSSPILYGNLLFLNFDGSDHQFVVALDKQTGKTIWKKDRSMDYKDLTPEGKVSSDGDFRKAFATSQIATIGGRRMLLSQAAKGFYAYDPGTGEELWRVEDRNSHSGGTRPVAGNGFVYFPTGWSTGQILAVRPGKDGEVLDVNAEPPPPSQPLQIAWHVKKNVPKKPSLLLIGQLLYAIDDNGVATCWEAETGTVVWNERIGGNYSAAPIAGDGHIYFCGEEGKVTVVAQGREFKKLAENQLEGGFMASPAVAGRSLILRSKTHLYRIEDSLDK